MFVETALTLVLAFIGECEESVQHSWQQYADRHELHIKLQADNDFYSQSAHLADRGLPLNAESLATLPNFLPCPCGKSVLTFSCLHHFAVWF